MSTSQLLLTDWTWSPWLIAGCAAGLVGYFALFGARVRAGWLIAGLAVAVLALASPINALAEGVLFSAHMAQHLLLLLIVPVFLLRALPVSATVPASVRPALHPLLCWGAGVGSMWFWHVPALCDAAAASTSVHAAQTLSLLALGTAFWWPIAAPSADDRVNPLGGIAYLFTACLACTALGIIITLTPVEVCPIFRTPTGSAAAINLVRNDWGFSYDRDRQIGGLLMWVPMCLVYMSAIFVELARWWGQPAARHAS